MEQPNGLDPLLRAGDQARSTGDLSSAEAIYKRATVTSPRSVDAWLRLGVVQLHSNELFAAAQSYRAAQAIDETNLDASFALGIIALRLGKPGAAVDELAVGLKTHPDDPQLNHAAGVAFALQRRFDIALEHYRRALVYDPQNVLIRADYGLLQLQTGDADGALATLEPTTQSPGVTDRARLILALSYLAVGKSTEALAIAPGLSESELRQILSENYPRLPPNRGASEQQIASQAFRNNVPAEERSAKPELKPTERKNAETTVPGSRGEAAGAILVENHISATSSEIHRQKNPKLEVYLVQLAAERSEERAREDWKRLQERHWDLLDDVSYRIVKAALGEKGTFYRIQVGPFVDLKEAEERCVQLKARQTDCFVLTSK